MDTFDCDVCGIQVQHKDYQETDGLCEDCLQNELADTLANCTDPNHPDYDPVFDKKIKTLRPDWFGITGEHN